MNVLSTIEKNEVSENGCYTKASFYKRDYGTHHICIHVRVYKVISINKYHNLVRPCLYLRPYIVYVCSEDSDAVHQSDKYYNIK